MWYLPRKRSRQSFHLSGQAVKCRSRQVSKTSSSRNTIPDQAHDSTQNNRERRWHLEVHATRIRRSDDDNPPWIPTQIPTILYLAIEISDFEEPVDSSEHKPHGRRVDASQTRFRCVYALNGRPESHEASVQPQTWSGDREIANESSDALLFFSMLMACFYLEGLWFAVIFVRPW
jgi:hypothetical protein